MKLSTQVGAGLVVLLMLMGALVVYQLLLARRLLDANRQMAVADIEMSRSSLRLNRQLGRLEDLTRRFLVLRDPAYIDQLSGARRQAAREIANLRTVAPEAGGVPALRALGLTWSGYLGLAGELEEAVTTDQASRDVGEPLLASIAELQHLVDSLDRQAAAQVSTRIEAGTEAAADAQRAALGVGVAGLLLSVGLAIWIGRGTAGPLRSLKAGTTAMSLGDFSHRVVPRGPAEIVALAENFNDMAHRLGELEELKRDFVANVSHDLKAPLASIQEANRFLLEEQAEGLDAEQRRLLELNTQAARRLEHMIGDLLDAARLEAGSVEFRTEPIDLIDCCEEALAHSAGLRAAKEIRLERHGFDQRVPVEVDPPMFLRALSNVLSNATDFSPASGTIRIGVRTLDPDDPAPAEAKGPPTEGRRQAVLTIEDEGPGVPEADRERIFDRFYRSASRSRPAGGTGLGLAIARSILRAHDGQIWVEPAPSGGSLFSILLPIAGGDDAPRAS